MARASTRTLIPLDRAAKTLGIDPLHFNSIESHTVSPIRTACDDFWTQHDWQKTGRAGREQFAIALRQAERDFIKYMKFSPLPDWVVDEDHQLTEPYRLERFNVSGRNPRGYFKSITSDQGYLIEPGVRATTLIDTPTITYSDTDSDNWDETATVSVATTVTDPQEIRVFFPNTSADPTWEIRPITVSISAGTATITFRRELVPLPAQWDIIDSNSSNAYVINGDDDAEFLTEVDVYRVYTSPVGQATFVSEARSGYSNLADVEESAKLIVRDVERGIWAYVRADYDSDEETWTETCFTKGIEPDRIVINYYAGYRDKSLTTPQLTMEPGLERLLVLYATTYMNQDMCGCEFTHNMVSHWRTDLAQVQSGEFTLTPPELFDNPFGSSRAGIALYRYLQTMRIRF